MAPKRDDFVEGLRGSGWNRYSPGYRNGELTRKAIQATTFIPPASSAPNALTYAPPANTTPRGGIDPNSLYSAASSGSYSSRSGSKTINIVLAVLGALLFAGIGASAGVPVFAAAAVGGIAGWILPFLIALVGQIIAFAVKLTIGVVKVLFVLALIAGTVLIILGLASK